MRTIEFNTSIVNGIIHMPIDYKGYMASSARIIILLEPDSKQEQKQNLHNVFANLQQLNVFSDIKNPVSWQKNIRDEWE